MLLLLGALLLRGNAPIWLETTAQGLLQHLSLLFVPAGVGVMVHIALIRAEWLPILATLTLTTIITMAVTALSLQGLARLRR
jgi:holin-like protein